MQTFIYLYLVSVPVFFIIDFIWLNYVAKQLYSAQLGHLLAPTFNIPAALIFYFIFLVGLTFFATFPGYTSGLYWKVALFGALFGFFTYATYDLTNLATLRDWPLSISLIDMAWGTVLSATVATAAAYIVKTFIA